MRTKGGIVNFERGRVMCLNMNLPVLCGAKIQIDNSFLNIHHHDDKENNDVLEHSNGQSRRRRN
jgi:hypothetical protein